MSFQRLPGVVRVPKNPVFTLPDAVWRGTGPDEGLYAFEGGGTWGRYVMVRDTDLCPSLIVDGSRHTPVFADVNGHIYWEGGGYVYHSRSWGWIHCKMFPGYEPIEEYVRDDDGRTHYEGDEFHTLGLPTAEGQERTGTPRGCIREEAPITVTLEWRRWTCDSEFGVYEPQSGASGTKVLGLPQFRGAGETFLRSLNRENGHFTYGRIHHASGKWVIGTVGSASGWHEGAEPSPDGGATTFRFCRPQGSEVQGADIAVAFDRYVCGSERDTAWIGEAAVWR